MGFDCIVRGQSGQATVEFVIVLAAFIAVGIAFGEIWGSLKEGLFVQHALQCASHHLSSAAPGAWIDVFAY